MTKNKKIAILTGGGDCPGINAVIRAVAKKAMLEHGWEVIGIEDGFEGLIHDRHRKLGPGEVSGILTLGGTILGTSNTSNPYRYAQMKGNKFVFKDVSEGGRRQPASARRRGARLHRRRRDSGDRFMPDE